MPSAKEYLEYLKIISEPDKIVKLARLDFLNADGTVAFSLDNNYKKGYGGYADSRAFLQSGTMTVSLQNGQRRKCDITLENMDGAFDFNVNRLWHGQQVRLMMGVKLSDGTPFLLPQGVFYFETPVLTWKPTERMSEYPLVDKWSYLDGNLFGTLRDSYQIPLGTNIFEVVQAVLQLSKYTLQETNRKLDMIDCVTPIFTDFYNNRTTTVNGTTYTYTIFPELTTIEYGNTYADIIEKCNDIIAGWVGYDKMGVLNILPSENDIADQTRPVLWDFSSESKTFLGFTETVNNGSTYNEVTIVGESTGSDSDTSPVGRAINDDPTSDTAISRIGRKSYVESSDGYYTNAQCEALAVFRLKRITTLQKSVTFTCSQLFHLDENSLVTVKRTDKKGSPVERHLIQSFSLPIEQTKTMTITATAVSDFPEVTTEEVDY